MLLCYVSFSSRLPGWFAGLSLCADAAHLYQVKSAPRENGPYEVGPYQHEVGPIKLQAVSNNYSSYHCLEFDGAYQTTGH